MGKSQTFNVIWRKVRKGVKRGRMWQIGWKWEGQFSRCQRGPRFCGEPMRSNSEPKDGRLEATFPDSCVSQHSE